VLARYDLETGHVFHAGDGNLHPCILCDPKDAAQMERVFAATHEIVAICIAKDGSITGEHGVGIEKRQHMPAMYSAAELAAMRDVKLAFDPDGLLNPGKVLPDDLPEPLRAAPGQIELRCPQRRRALPRKPPRSWPLAPPHSAACGSFPSVAKLPNRSYKRSALAAFRPRTARHPDLCARRPLRHRRRGDAAGRTH
jgi:hypothetical protein